MAKPSSNPSNVFDAWNDARAGAVSLDRLRETLEA